MEQEEEQVVREVVRLGPCLLELSLLSSGASSQVSHRHQSWVVSVRVLADNSVGGARPNVAVMVLPPLELQVAPTVPEPTTHKRPAPLGLDLNIIAEHHEDEDEGKCGQGDEGGRRVDAEPVPLQRKRRRVTAAEHDDDHASGAGEDSEKSDPRPKDIEMLPDAVLVRVLIELPAVELVASVPLISRRWNRLARDPRLWLQAHHQRFRGRPVPPSNVGYTKLDEIIIQSHVGVVRMLIARGAITQEQGDRALAEALVRAVDGQEAKQVRRLLEAGASAKGTDLLYRLAWCFHYEAQLIGAMLLRHGARIDSEPASDTRLTLLESVVQQGNKTAVQWLLENGAKPVLRLSMLAPAATQVRHGRRKLAKAIRVCKRKVASAADQAAKRDKQRAQEEEKDDDKNDKDYVDDQEDDQEDD